MFSSLLSVLSALLLAFSYLATAAPVQPVELIAFAPTITSPSTGTIWLAGTKQNVTWVTSNVPSSIQDSTLVILLGFFANNSENLDIQHPLANSVPIMQGFAEITVPSNATLKTDYTVVVIGDSGDASKPFTILPNPLAGN